MAARQTRRWHLTDVQRLFVAITVAVALFLAFMAVGMSSGVLLVVALLLLVVVGLLVFLLGLRHSGVAPTQAEARVLSAPAAPVGKIVSACDMRLHVELPDGRSMETRHRDPSVTVTKWPRVGTVLPVEIDPRSRSLRIRWDRVAAEHPGAGDDRAPAGPAGSSVLHRLRRRRRVAPGGDPGRRDGHHPVARASAGHHGDEHPHPVRWPDRTGPGTGTGPDPNRSPNRSRDRSPTSPSLDPELRARAAEYELPQRTIPQPRPSEPAVRRSAGDGTRAADETPAADDTAGMGAMLIVSDLHRSVSFYRDQVGLRLLDQAANTAVLSFGTGRVLLRQLADMSQVDRRVAHLHIQVSDVDTGYRDLSRPRASRSCTRPG